MRWETKLERLPSVVDGPCWRVQIPFRGQWEATRVPCLDNALPGLRSRTVTLQQLHRLHGGKGLGAEHIDDGRWRCRDSAEVIGLKTVPSLEKQPWGRGSSSLCPNLSPSFSEYPQILSAVMGRIGVDMSPIPVSPHSGQLSLSTMERDRSLPPERPPGQLQRARRSK